MEKTNEATPEDLTLKGLAIKNMCKYYGTEHNFWKDAEDAEYEIKLFMDGYNKAVNAYDSLVEEVQRLKADIEERSEAASLSNKDKRNLVDRAIELQAENQKLRDKVKLLEQRIKFRDE